MANSCAINPYLRREGKVIPSELWEDLKKYHTRKRAVDWYGIAIDKEFLDYIEKAGLVNKEWEVRNGQWQIKENEDFDKNGQLWHGALIRVLKRHRKYHERAENKFLDELAKAVWRTFNLDDKSDLEDGVFTDYNEKVIGAIMDFNNKESSYSKSYMATIEWNESRHKYHSRLKEETKGT